MSQEQSQFALQRIYLKDLSFESPLAPNIFQQNWQPQVKLEANNDVAHIDQDNYEVTLKLTVTAKLEDQTAFIIELHQAGIFLCKGLENQALQRLLHTACPNILFPYAREAIDNMANRGTFPPLFLAPINFDALYEQAQKQRAEQNQANSETVH